MTAHSVCAPGAVWLADISRNLGIPSDRVPAVAWSLYLRPGPPVVDIDDAAVAIYRSIDWIRSLPVDREITVRTVRRSGPGETAVETTASLDGEKLATSQTVTLVPGTGGRSSTVPDRPSTTGLEPVTSVVINDVLAEDFARLGGGAYALSEDPGFARRHGYPDALAQEGLALALLATCRPLPASGRVSIWYGAPLPVGSLVSLLGTADAQLGSVWSVRLPGRSIDAAIIQLEDAR